MRVIIQHQPYKGKKIGEWLGGTTWKHSSAGLEHFPYKEGVTGPNPVVSTELSVCLGAVLLQKANLHRLGVLTLNS